MENQEGIRMGNPPEPDFFRHPSNLSLTGCSPAEPVSVSFDSVNVGTIYQNQIQ
jgi:hypothetical protein